MNFPLLVAGSLALLGAGIHGVAGEALVVRRLSPGGLQSSPFGSPGFVTLAVGVADAAPEAGPSPALLTAVTLKE